MGISIDTSATPLSHPRLLQGVVGRHASIDPTDPPTWTGTWRDPRFSPPADAGLPENALQGNALHG